MATLILRLDRALGYGVLRSAWWSHRRFKRLGEGQQFLIGRIQVNLLPKGLTNLIGGGVVEFDAVVFRVIKIHAAGNTMGHRAVNPQPLILESVIERAHIIQVLYFERDLLDVVRFFARGLWPAPEPVRGARPRGQR